MSTTRPLPYRTHALIGRSKITEKNLKISILLIFFPISPIKSHFAKIHKDLGRPEAGRKRSDAPSERRFFNKKLLVCGQLQTGRAWVPHFFATFTDRRAGVRFLSRTLNSRQFRASGRPGSPNMPPTLETCCLSLFPNGLSTSRKSSKRRRRSYTGNYPDLCSH